MTEEVASKKSRDDEHNKETIPEEVLHSKDGPYKLKPKSFQEKNNDNKTPILEDQIDQVLYDIKNYSLLVNKLDTYGNSIPLGSFCFAISFILIGFKESKVNKVEEDDYFFYLIILIFGCIGQLIAGLFEYIKGRTFVSNLYLLYGLYFLCYFHFFYNNKEHSDEEKSFSQKEIRSFYYGSWAVLSFPIFIGSVQSNVFYLVQTAVAWAFFIVRCIGEYYDKAKMKEIVSGVLELVTGFISLYICVNQIINESFRFKVIPSVPLSPDNEIDINLEK